MKGGAGLSVIDPCPPYCLDPDCNCVIYGHRIGGQCVYDQFCSFN